MKNGPKAYLITGGTGAGKTTYARRLADEVGGVRFSIDDWMTHLFWMDSPDEMTYDWAMERIARAERQIWETASQIIERGRPVIFDLGFTKADHREKFAKLLRGATIPFALHWVDVPSEQRWARVETRNAEKGETFAMVVTRDMFDFMESIWQAPLDSEMKTLNGIRAE